MRTSYIVLGEALVALADSRLSLALVVALILLK